MGSSSTFVPLEAWVYNSPDLHRVGKKVDIGLLAEALIYYDQVYFAFTSDEQFARVVAWFQGQGAVEELASLIRDGVLVPYYYSFVTLAGTSQDVWNVMNIQDEQAAKEAVFEARVLRSGRLDGLVRKASLRERLVAAAVDRHVEVKAEEFGSSLGNARSDYQSQERTSFLLQIVVDELYRDMGYPKPPVIQARIQEQGNARVIDWGFDFKEFQRKLGPNLAVSPGMPLAGAAFGVKTMWSASQLESDIYVGAPISSYLEYKLGESNRVSRAKAIIDELVSEVAFPDVRALVNRGKIGLREVMVLRKKADRFRQWLREEVQLDRNAIVAYHEEIAKSAGWKKNLGTTIKAAGVFGGAAAGAVLAGPLGAVGGALAGEALKYVVDLASSIDKGWRPRVFGEWARARIDQALKKPE